MSKQRIRHKGSDGKDLVLDVDLGPDRAGGNGTMGALTMGDMQPILTGRSHGLGRRGPEDGWVASRHFVITGMTERSRQLFEAPRQNNP
jgi:hypothetical protein